MNITKSSVVGALLSLTVVAACGRDDKSTNNNVDAGGGGDTGSGSGGGMTIKDVQADAMKSGTAIELHGVVVTAIDAYGGTTGDFWVQDIDGGVRSGVHIYGASPTDVAKLAVGDLVDIKGAQKFEFPLKTPALPSTQTLTEVEGTSKGSLVVTKTGTGTVPAPHVLDSVAIAAMSATDRAAFLEDWEGVPVTLQNARPINPGTFGSGGDDQKSFQVENVLTIESNMAAFPTSAATAATCYASVTGIVDFVASIYTLLPYSTAGFIDGGTSCPAQTIAVDATVAEVQAGTKTGLVKLTGVYVTAAAFFNGAASKTIWVSDSLAAAPGTGVEVFSATTGVDATTRPYGTKVDVQGTIVEFSGILTEFAQNTAVVTLNTARAANPTPLTGIPVATLADITNGKPYEGSLVTITNVIVIDDGSGTTNKFKLADNNNNAIIMDDDVISGYKDDKGTIVPAKGKCFKSITGVLDAQKTDNARTINPRSVADVVEGVAGTDCTGTVP